MRTIVVAFLLAVSALIANGLAGYGNQTGQAYVTEPVERGSIDTLVKATGTVNAVVMVDVGSQLSGQISEVLVNFNDLVKSGQVIARVNPETYIAALNEAKAVLKIAKATAQLQKSALEKARVATDNARTARKVAEAELAAAQVQQAETERNFQRNLLLNKTTAISDREFTQSRALRDVGAANLEGSRAQLTMKDEAIKIADAELSMAEANLASAEAVVEQKQASLQQAEVDLQRTEIRAPIDGVVIKRAINSGQTVAVSLESKTLFKIANDMSEMEVHGKIDEADIGRVKAGQRVTFTVDAYPNKIFSGRVLQVRKSPEVSQSVVSYTAVVSAPNPDQLLFPGMTARLQIVVDETKDALKIPNPALLFRPNADAPAGKQSAGSGTDAATVWVVNNTGAALPVPVTIGKSDEFGTQLLSGNLGDGDRVIVGLGGAAGRSGLLGLW
jgi:HlyD family secretion protein